MSKSYAAALCLHHVAILLCCSYIQHRCCNDLMFRDSSFPMATRFATNFFLIHRLHSLTSLLFHMFRSSGDNVLTPNSFLPFSTRACTVEMRSRNVCKVPHPGPQLYRPMFFSACVDCTRTKPAGVSKQCVSTSTSGKITYHLVPSYPGLLRYSCACRSSHR